jgi:hypothetical protein
MDISETRKEMEFIIIFNKLWHKYRSQYKVFPKFQQFSMSAQLQCIVFLNYYDKIFSSK